MSVGVLRRRFTVDEYHRMVDAGILHPDDRVELLDGEVVQMSPKGCGHAACVSRLTDLLTERLRRRAIVRIQDPVQLDDYWEPEPDVAIVQSRNDFYADGHPKPADVRLIIEVADSSLLNDRRQKIPRYAAAGISESWLANIPERVLEVYRRVGQNGYEESLRLGHGETATPLAFPDCPIAVDEVLGPP